MIIADPETPLALPQTGGLMTYATPAALALVVLVALYIAIGARSRKKANKAA
ncbi:MAG: LPXTG cell wall anchor domain-containing protein [Clostridiales Family XIII bacterium]|nr:LPXTG cell wall anchor domain-containing protein [Clostridiales Family XIII bacterium]